MTSSIGASALRIAVSPIPCHCTPPLERVPPSCGTSQEEVGEGRLAQEGAQWQAQEVEAAQKVKAEAEIPACKDAEWQAQDETVGQMAKSDEESLRHEKADQHALEAPHTADAEAESRAKEEAAKSQVAFPLLGPSWGPLGALLDRPGRLGPGHGDRPHGR